MGKVVEDLLVMRAVDLAWLFGKAFARWEPLFLVAERRREVRLADIMETISIRERSAASTLSGALLAGHWTVS